MPLVRRTRATLRSAEFGFFGVLVYTRVHTPRRWGAPFRAAVLPLAGFDSRPLRTSCWMVGTGVLRSGGAEGGGSGDLARNRPCIVRAATLNGKRGRPSRGQE